MYCLIQWPVCTLHLFGISLPSTLNYSTKNSTPQMGGTGVCPWEKAALWSVRREQHVSVNGHLSSDTGPVSSDLPLPAPASLSLYALRNLSRAGYPRTVSSVRAQPMPCAVWLRQMYSNALWPLYGALQTYCKLHVHGMAYFCVGSTVGKSNILLIRYRKAKWHFSGANKTHTSS